MSGTVLASQSQHLDLFVENQDEKGVQHFFNSSEGSRVYHFIGRNVSTLVEDLSINSEDVIEEDLEVVESTKLTPEQLFSMLEKESDKTHSLYQSKKDSLEAELQSSIEDDLQLIERRIGFWSEQIGLIKSLPRNERADFKQDIVDGGRLLLGRIYNIQAELYREPRALNPLGQVRLRREADRSGKRSTKISPPRPKEREQDVRHEGLINHDIGYGRELMLRPHQIESLDVIKGEFARVRDNIKTNGLTADFLQGTIVMPVGGGKTRTMVASFAAAIEQGLHKDGDKFIILNHTTQIHEQNLQVTELLAPYFEKQFGRPLKVSEYKAESKDLSGDVVVVSIPSVTRKDGMKAFDSSLYHTLGDNKMSVVAIDESHHIGLQEKQGTKKSWLKLVERMRKISPTFYRLGFTATPTGKEGRILTRVREMDLMHARVTPRTYYVPVQGLELPQLKSKSDKTLELELLRHPDNEKRNTRMWQAIDQHGMRRENGELEPSVIFGGSIKHALNMARSYKSYFDREGRPLKIIGEDRGRISKGDIASLKTGAIAIVSGNTSDTVMQQLFKKVDEGKIEAVFTVDKLFEGADLWMFSHQVGGRPTYSMIKKGQERGRTNRRSPGDVTDDGRILRDAPKILFDVRDWSRGDHIVSYNEMIFNFPVAIDASKHGQLIDMMTGESVDSVDRKGKVIRISPKIKTIKREIREGWEKPIIEKLLSILEIEYKNDLDSMAYDLGITVEEFERMLNEKAWVQVG
ncbi:MAG: DEAD/DEAH box helicase family protein, partial [Pseudomonadota bacterium]